MAESASAVETGGKPLPFTPTWAVAAVMAVLVLLSFAVERSIHLLGRWLARTKRKPLFQSLEKMKEELMLLGFISLFLSVLSGWLSAICIDASLYDKEFIPCKKDDSHSETVLNSPDRPRPKGRLLSFTFQRFLGEGQRLLFTTDAHTCGKDKEPLISLEGLHQLHQFLFVMAITHIFYSCMTMLLALIKVYGWKGWELEAHGDGYDTLTEITKSLTLRRQSTFVLYHTSSPWSHNRFFIWVVCFLRQFGRSVTRADFLALRSGFITKHNVPHDYNFHSYMIRCMEDEFTKIVGITAPLWGFAVVFILLNVDGFNFYFWISFVPIIIILLVGAKLQHVIATLALENVGVVGSLVGANLRPRDELFWFRKPELLLWLLHFILFQNAFELATFLWSWWQFPDHSCVMKNRTLVYIRLISGAAVQVLCSYSTLPLYALVTQMGSSFKKAMIPAEIRQSIHNWHKAAKKRVKLGDSDRLHQDNSSQVEKILDGTGDIVETGGMMGTEEGLLTNYEATCLEDEDISIQEEREDPIPENPVTGIAVYKES